MICIIIGRDKKKKEENGKTVEIEGEIDLIIQENVLLYPIEIEMYTMPKVAMASEFDVLDSIPDKKEGWAPSSASWIESCISAKTLLHYP